MCLGLGFSFFKNQCISCESEELELVKLHHAFKCRTKNVDCPTYFVSTVYIQSLMELDTTYKMILLKEKKMKTNIYLGSVCVKRFSTYKRR